MTILRYFTAIDIFWSLEDNTLAPEDIPLQALLDCLLLNLLGRPFSPETHDKIDSEFSRRIKSCKQ